MSKNSLTLTEKKRILKEIDSQFTENTINTSKLSKKLNLPRSTLATILKNKDVIVATATADDCRFRVPNKRRNPSRGIGKYHELEKKLEAWISETGGIKAVFSKDVRKKAKEISVDMGIENFTASNGWLDRFKKRLVKPRKCFCKSTPDTQAIRVSLPSISSQDYLSVVLQRPKEEICEGKPKWSQYKQVARDLMVWQYLAEAEGVRVTGRLLQDMSFSIAAALRAEHFAGSTGWLSNYKKKRRREICSECKKETQYIQRVVP